MTAATRKGRATDEAFKEAARVVFARDGYLNAKITDIAAQAGRSAASFYNYYDTKADLLIALAEDFHAEATSLATMSFRAGLARPEALREAVAGFWRTYAKRRGELIGIFQAAMVEGRFRDRWLELRMEAITRIAAEVRLAQAQGYCPGVDPVMTASALSAMLEHFCYIWLGQGGEKDVPFDDERALDAVATIWVQAVYWRPESRAAGGYALRVTHPPFLGPGRGQVRDKGTHPLSLTPGLYPIAGRWAGSVYHAYRSSCAAATRNAVTSS